VLENDLIGPFVTTMIRMMAPVVAEISKRSPNPAELSLKVENDTGRREEIYVRKADLLAKLEPLSPAERRVFEPFGIFPRAVMERGESLPDDAIWEA
jgi:hypothetical protein